MVKAVGGSGTVSKTVEIPIRKLNTLVPKLLIVATLKLYVVPGVNPVTVKEAAV